MPNGAPGYALETVDRRELGQAGEEAAVTYLSAHRYTVIERNYRHRGGELDLVALDGPVVVFVEVRTRRGERRGTPLESVDHRKQRRLTAAAQHYLLARRLTNRPARFDVIGVHWERGAPRIEHVRDAFEAQEL